MNNMLDEGIKVLLTEGKISLEEYQEITSKNVTGS